MPVIPSYMRSCYWKHCGSRPAEATEKKQAWWYGNLALHDFLLEDGIYNILNLHNELGITEALE
jgi:hypothetical protein